MQTSNFHKRDWSRDFKQLDVCTRCSKKFAFQLPRWLYLTKLQCHSFHRCCVQRKSCCNASCNPVCRTLRTVRLVSAELTTARSPVLRLVRLDCIVWPVISTRVPITPVAENTSSFVSLLSSMMLPHCLQTLKPSTGSSTMSSEPQRHFIDFSDAFFLAYFDVKSDALASSSRFLCEPWPPNSSTCRNTCSPRNRRSDVHAV